MELGLSLGNTSEPFGLSTQGNDSKQLEKPTNNKPSDLGLSLTSLIQQAQRKSQEIEEGESVDLGSDDNNNKFVQLNFLPLAPFPENGGSPEASSEYGNSGGGGGKREFEVSTGNDVVEGSRASDDDENAPGCRKKLRLSKQQSAFLEESFKEHNTLNPKQKMALAKELNLRPRQVEVWFQNRRARTKLKQTEVDCEYLKRVCETLSEENRRLHKELQDLRTLKSSNPFQMPTTLTMCPSCQRVANAPPPAPSST